MSEMEEKEVNQLPRFGMGEQLLEQYELEIDAVVKGRGCLIVKTKEANYMFQEFSGSKEKVATLAKVLQELQSWDQNNENLVANREGEYFVREEDGPAYILKTYKGGKECDIKNPLEVMEGVRKLGDLHLALADITLDEEDYLGGVEHGFVEEIARHNRELKSVKNYIRKKKQKTEFEEAFEASYGYFYQQAKQMEEWAKRMEADEVENQRRQPEEIANEAGANLKKRALLCHGDYHYHNVYDCGGNSHILHFEKMRIENQMTDLAKYMRKVLEKNHWDAKLGMEMLHTYEKVRAIDEQDRVQLFVRMAYPEKYWKIVNHYNNHKKIMASKRDGEKLLHMMGEEQNRQEFLEILYNEKN